MMMRRMRMRMRMRMLMIMMRRRMIIIDTGFCNPGPQNTGCDIPAFVTEESPTPFGTEE